MIAPQESTDFESSRSDIEPRQQLIEKLTPRELEILALVCDGHSNEEISTLLKIRLATVKYHVTNCFGKIGVCRRTQAVAVAIHLQLVKPSWLFREVTFNRQHLSIQMSEAPALRQLLSVLKSN